MKTLTIAGVVHETIVECGLNLVLNEQQKALLEETKLKPTAQRKKHMGVLALNIRYTEDMLAQLRTN